MSISVLILTLNEELNLPKCLKSVAWSDDIVVLDSGSTDRTVEIAKNASARVITKPFINELEHRLYSLHEISFKHKWVYNPDADEVTPEDLRDEMLSVVSEEDRDQVAYRVRFKVMFTERWIKHSSLYPTWVMRLFQPDKISLARKTNLTYTAGGPTGTLNSHFLHYSFRNGMDAWRKKHLKYAKAEADELIRTLSKKPMEWVDLFSLNPVRRRKALKELSFRLPFRPTARFVYMYILSLGFLDGYPGLKYCQMLSWYERMIDQYANELRAKKQRTND